MLQDRRDFISGLAAAIAAPAIARASSLMPLRGNMIYSTAFGGGDFLVLAHRMHGRWKVLHRVDRCGDLAQPNPPDLFAEMTRLLYRLPPVSMTAQPAPSRPLRDLRFVCDRMTRQYMDIQAMGEWHGFPGPLTVRDGAGGPFAEFRNIPIECLG